MLDCKENINQITTNFQAVTKDKIKLEKPQFKEGVRTTTSIGGRLILPALWGNYSLVEVSEILDEAFVYVHTMKEPSSIFHEHVKALKTIIEYQKKYDELKDVYKNGNMCEYNIIKEYLLNDCKIGFCAPIIYHSTKNTIKMEKPSFKKYVDEINSESIAEVISTKAVISDIDRTLTEKKQRNTRNQINNTITKMNEFQEKQIEQAEAEKTHDYYLKTKSNYYPDTKLRQKVFETVIDVLEKNPELERTVELANKFITKDNGYVLADICIKAQYGAKREFYVLNITAKAIARCTENFFKKLSENSPNEAISTPGDEKIIKMQKKC